MRLLSRRGEAALKDTEAAPPQAAAAPVVSAAAEPAPTPVVKTRSPRRRQARFRRGRGIIHDFE